MSDALARARISNREEAEERVTELARERDRYHEAYDVLLQNWDAIPKEERAEAAARLGKVMTTYLPLFSRRILVSSYCIVKGTLPVQDGPIPRRGTRAIHISLSITRWVPERLYTPSRGARVPRTAHVTATVTLVTLPDSSHWSHRLTLHCEGGAQARLCRRRRSNSGQIWVDQDPRRCQVGGPQAAVVGVEGCNRHCACLGASAHDNSSIEFSAPELFHTGSRTHVLNGDARRTF